MVVHGTPADIRWRDEDGGRSRTGHRDTGTARLGKIGRLAPAARSCRPDARHVCCRCCCWAGTALVPSHCHRTLPPHTATAHYSRTLQPRTAAVHCRRTLTPHTTAAHCCCISLRAHCRHTIPPHTSVVHYCCTLQQHTAAAHYRRILPPHTAAAHSSYTFLPHTTAAHCCCTQVGQSALARQPVVRHY
jgi:hypothetical protein